MIKTLIVATLLLFLTVIVLLFADNGTAKQELTGVGVHTTTNVDESHKSYSGDFNFVGTWENKHKGIVYGRLVIRKNKTWKLTTSVSSPLDQSVSGQWNRYEDDSSLYLDDENGNESGWYCSPGLDSKTIYVKKDNSGLLYDYKKVK